MKVNKNLENLHHKQDKELKQQKKQCSFYFMKTTPKNKLRGNKNINRNGMHEYMQ